MDKNATDLLNLALLSLLTGAGTYAGGRGIHDLAQKNKEKEEPNTLNITLPEARMPKQANTSVSEDYLQPALTTLLGLGGGFFGASNIYEHFKKKQLKQELSDVEKQYLQTLQHARNKTAEEHTPNVDEFIVGMLSKIGESVAAIPGLEECLEKTSANLDFLGLPSFPGKEGVTDTMFHQIGNAGSAFMDTELGKAAIAASLLFGGLGAGLGFLTPRHLDNKEDSYKKNTSLPTDIRLHVAK